VLRERKIASQISLGFRNFSGSIVARRVRKRSFLSPLSTTVTMRAKRNLVDRQIEGAKPG